VVVAAVILVREQDGGKVSTKTYERVPFRMYRMPCCGFTCCWVNPNRPAYCPECGTDVYLDLRRNDESLIVRDDDAVLEYAE
jgi:hypothetical protein